MPPRTAASSTGSCPTTSRSFPQWRHRYPPGTTHNTEHVFGLAVPEPDRRAAQSARAPSSRVAAVAGGGAALLLVDQSRRDPSASRAHVASKEPSR